MLRSFTFGCGQGATKAMMQCIEDGVLNKSDCKVVNSTSKDIPSEYIKSAIIISDDPDAGCGKVREAAKDLMYQWICENINSLKSLLCEYDNETNEYYPIYDYINIMATTEGASGSGASVVLAQYIKKELNIPVIITLISGFESDTRGLQNTINYFKDLEGGDFIIKTISNKKYLDQTSNVFTAEKMANKDISKMMSVIETQDIINSDQNIDDTDLYKLITNPGLMYIGHMDIDKKIKNSEQIDKMICDMIDYTTSLDFEPSATKIGIFMNVTDSTLEKVDTEFTSIKKKLCSDTLPELFVHKQYNGKNEFIRIIATGINLPKQELMEMYNKYTDSTNKINNSNDDFFSALSNMTVKQNALEKKQSNTNNDFFSDFKPAKSETTEESNSVLSRTSRRGRRRSILNTNNNQSQSSETSGRSFSTKNKKEEPYTEDSMNNF